MSSNSKMTRGVSHKKKKTLVASIKIENANIAKKAKLNSPPRSSRTSSNVIIAINDENDDESMLTPTSIVAINSPTTRRKKSDSYYKVTSNRLNLAFRTSSKVDVDYTNMLPQISKEINGNFNLVYKRRITTHRRSNRNRISLNVDSNSNAYSNPFDNQSLTSDNEIEIAPNSPDPELILCKYLRCYVEDFMLRSVGERLLVLIPSHYSTMSTTKWLGLFESDISSSPVEFTNHQFVGYTGVVSTNPFFDNVSNGMHLSDYQSGFGTHNYGCHITFSEDTESILITWQEVLDGGKNGLQVWRLGDIYRDVYSNFADRCKTSQGLTGLMNTLYSEVYGDRLQCLHLMNCYNRAIMKNQMKLVRTYEDVIQKYNPVVLVGEEYESLLENCNDAFGAAIKKCYCDFVVIGQPIITREVIDGLVQLYKNKMSNHYNTMHTMMGFKRKEGLTRNKHLIEIGYYDRQVFYSFLAMSRQMNPQKMLNWAIISSGANYGRGLGDMVNRRSTYLGASATTQTYLKVVKPFGDAMLSNIAIRLSGLSKTVWMLDNNQKGHPKKFQRFGSSNKFVKVTGRTARNCILCEDDLEEENSKRVPITYIDQAIINPVNFPVFEQEIHDIDCNKNIQQCLLRKCVVDSHAVKLDLTGERVSIYNTLIDIVNTIEFTVLPLLSGYNATKKVYKRWRSQPEMHYSTLRMKVMKIMQSEKPLLREIDKFQSKIVDIWNPKAKECSSLIIPPISLRDEIKTNGYGMAIIELLCLSGILIHTICDVGGDSWVLVKDWEDRTLYLCMDGLSLDRHRSFQKKLIKLPYSYTKVFKQSIIFQKALTRVIDISGPLHIAFHMLQSIFIIYKDMMKWSQTVLNWKKVNVNKVSESFDTCRQMCMLTLEEVERLSIDLFMVRNDKSVEDIIESSESADSIGLNITRLYIEYIHEMDSNDHRRLYMFGFIIMATQFRNYWKATRTGDRVTMEYIQNKWIGVHLMSGKHKCVENYLNAIELEYKSIDNIALQEIRMNISVRYHADIDKTGHIFPLHPLDEVQENINQWTKRILLGPGETSWRSHSPNVASAHMCINFEEVEFTKNNNWTGAGVTSKPLHRSKKTVTPRKVLEKERLYEWVIAMFNEEVPNRACVTKDGYAIIKTLKIKLVSNDTNEKIDGLDNCIGEMFNEREEAENTILTIHDDYTNIPDSDGQNEVGDNNNSNTTNATEPRSTSSSVTKTSLGNVFILGRTKMIEMKIPLVRERKQNRILRSRAFFLDINETVIKMEEDIDVQLDRITNVTLFNPWYRTAYRAISK